MLLMLSGDWTARSPISRAPAPGLLLERSDTQTILFDSSNLGRWDSSLLIFLSSLREASKQRHIVFD
jgi:hypothetical protein